MTAPLPRYGGRLAAAGWSEIELTAAVRARLSNAALRGCPVCGGRGFTGGPERGQPCHCVNRPLERTNGTP